MLYYLVAPCNMQARQRESGEGVSRGWPQSRKAGGRCSPCTTQWRGAALSRQMHYARRGVRVTNAAPSERTMQRRPKGLSPRARTRCTMHGARLVETSPYPELYSRCRGCSRSLPQLIPCALYGEFVPDFAAPPSCAAPGRRDYYTAKQAISPPKSPSLTLLSSSPALLSVRVPRFPVPQL